MRPSAKHVSTIFERSRFRSIVGIGSRFVILLMQKRPCDFFGKGAVVRAERSLSEGPLNNRSCAPSFRYSATPVDEGVPGVMMEGASGTLFVGLVWAGAGAGVGSGVGSLSEDVGALDVADMTLVVVVALEVNERFCGAPQDASQIRNAPAAPTTSPNTPPPRSCAKL